MNGTATLFSVGQYVNITDNLYRKNCGDGPFEVIEVEDVPTECTCGLTEYIKGCGHDHSELCQSRLVNESVGHPQWVTIMTGKGKRRSSGVMLELYYNANVEVCPHCGSGRVGPSTLGGPGCRRSCYECCYTS